MTREIPTYREFAGAASRNIAQLFQSQIDFDGERIDSTDPEAVAAASKRFQGAARGFDVASKEVAELIAARVSNDHGGLLESRVHFGRRQPAEVMSFVGMFGFNQNPADIKTAVEVYMRTSPGIDHNPELEKLFVFLTLQADLLSSIHLIGDMVEHLFPPIYAFLRENGTNRNHFSNFTFNEFFFKYGRNGRELSEFLEAYIRVYITEKDSPHRSGYLQTINPNRNQEWLKETIAQLPLTAIPLLLLDQVFRAYGGNTPTTTIQGKALY